MPALALLAALAAGRGAPEPVRRPAPKPAVPFVPNTGQTDPRAEFVAETSGYQAFFTREDARIVLYDPPSSLDPRDPRPSRGMNLFLEFVGAGSEVRIESAGDDIAYRNLWPGIDMVFRSGEGRLKYEFVVRPGADPAAIRLAYRGADRIAVDDGGRLLIDTPHGVLMDEPPVSDQGTVRYVVDGEAFGFDAEYDPTRTLVIDPAIVYSGYLSGSSYEPTFNCALDSGGNLYVTGATLSLDFPVTPGAFDTSFAGDYDAFVAKIGAWATFLGGSGFDFGISARVDASGFPYVAGATASADFGFGPAVGYDTHFDGTRDGFVAKLTPAGNGLVFFTFLGGSGADAINDIALGANGKIHAVGYTESADFPLQAPLDGTLGGERDGFIAIFNSSGINLTYSTYFGGSGADSILDLALDAGGDVYVAGGTQSADLPAQGSLRGPGDAFVARLKAPRTLVFSTYYGGAGDDIARGVAVDSSGRVAIAGDTVGALSDSFYAFMTTR